MKAVVIESVLCLSRSVFRRLKKPRWELTAVLRNGSSIRINLGNEYPGNKTVRLKLEPSPYFDDVVEFVLSCGPPPEGLRIKIPYKVSTINEETMKTITPLQASTPTPTSPPSSSPTPALPSGDNLEVDNPILGFTGSQDATKTTQIMWIRDLPFEEDMRKAGVKFQLVEYDIRNVDLHESQKNPIRTDEPDGVNKERVAQITQDLVKGPVALWKPFFIVRGPTGFANFKTDPGKDMAGGGNHRIRAMLPLGFVRSMAYLIEPENIGEIIFRQLTLDHTKREGQGASDANRMTAALTEASLSRWPSRKGYAKELLQRYDLPADHKATRQMQDRLDLNRFRALIAAGGRLAAPGGTDLPPGVLASLGRLDRKDPVTAEYLLKELVKMPVPPLVASVRSLVAQIMDLASDADRKAKAEAGMVIVREAASCRKVGGIRNLDSTILAGLTSAMKSCQALCQEGYSIEDIIPDADRRREIAASAKKVRDTLDDLLKRFSS